jgi:hypothetical protein
MLRFDACAMLSAGVKFCVKVSAFPFSPAVDPNAGVIQAVKSFNSMATSPEAAALAAGPGSGVCLAARVVLYRRSLC